MPDQELDILVRTIADTHGADNVQRSLAKLTKTTDETGAGFKKVTRAGKETKQLINALSREFPMLGLAMKAAFSPIGATVAGALVAFRTLKSYIAELNAELDKMEDAARRPIGDIKQALYEATAVVARNRREIEQWHNSLNNVLQKQKEVFDQEVKRIRDAEAATKLLIQAKVKAGLLTPEAGAAGEAAATRKADLDERRMREIRVGELSISKADAEAKLSEMESKESDRDVQGRITNRQAMLASIDNEVQRLRDMPGKERDAMRSKAQQFEAMAEFARTGKVSSSFPYSVRAKAYMEGVRGEESATYYQGQAEQLRSGLPENAIPVAEARRAQIQQQVIADEELAASFAKLKAEVKDLTASLDQARSSLAAMKQSPQMAGAAGRMQVEEMRGKIQEMSQGGFSNQELSDMRLMFREIVAALQSNLDMTAQSRTALVLEVDRLRQQVNAAIKSQGSVPK